MNFSLSIGIILSGKSGSIRKIHVRIENVYDTRERRRRIRKLKLRQKLYLFVESNHRIEGSLVHVHICVQGTWESPRGRDSDAGGFHVYACVSVGVWDAVYKFNCYAKLILFLKDKLSAHNETIERHFDNKISTKFYRFCMTIELVRQKVTHATHTPARTHNIIVHEYIIRITTTPSHTILNAGSEKKLFPSFKWKKII